ncbi:hypothetical protein [Pseudokineococcus marinus]|uniref:Uncharacterized protein n=1 Tax=Pseudokineococcus marinus TaxID=351215 RepID=A0A849BZG0_9ACTN|nr:hypothetical protein [Pseudokineococcus marinus]NNH22868.1 hypothetical protein [Pseudokineococcus marinus]
MSATARTADRAPGSHSSVPRWAWVVMVLLLLVAVVAVTVAVFAPRGQQSLGAAPEEGAPPAAPVAPTPSASPSPSPGQTEAPEQASGCLGGPAELDAAVLAAQEQAPLTAEGAASFAATVFRWATGSPAAPFQADTAEQVLSSDATDAAQAISGTQDAAGTTSSTSFADGRYYVESYDGTSAIVSVLGTGSGTVNGAAVAEAQVWGSLRLEAVNGTWRLQDVTDGRSVEDLERIGTPYVGGC